MINQTLPIVYGNSQHWWP